jgi:hypothetical protein
MVEVVVVGREWNSRDFLQVRQPCHSVKEKVVLKFPGAVASNEVVIDHMNTAGFGRKLHQIPSRYLVGADSPFALNPN